MSPRRWALGALLVALIVSLGTPTPAQARAGTPGSQPFPGYTISNPSLAPLTVGRKQTRVIQGVRKHAAYDIEIPPHWNGQLVMWAHGYRGTGTVLTVDPPAYGLRQRFVNQGYAWAASSYARNDYDVATGVTTTHDLARFAARKLGREPKRTYVAGVSMGGHVIGRSLEQYQGFYSGALPMCGVLGDQELFDYFLSYNLVGQDLADHKAYPPPSDYLSSDVPQIEQALGLVGLEPGGPDTTNAAGKQFRAIATNLTGGTRPGADNAFAYWKDFPFSLFTPDTGGSLAQNAARVAQNLDTVYRPNTPVDVNASVQRVAPRDAYARQTNRLTQIPRIQGRPDVPVLTLHGLGDYYVPFSMEEIYARDVARNGQSLMLAQRAVREAGHCEFTPREAGRAWNDLVRWVKALPHGREATQRDYRIARAAGDSVLDPAKVASPTYGCRFTDQSAYDSPTLYPTRSLYPRCP